MTVAKNNTTISGLAAAEAKAEQARAKLAEAQQAYKELSVAAQAAVDADLEMRRNLNAGSTAITAEQIIETPQKAQAAVELANAAKVLVRAAQQAAGVAEHNLIAHQVREQASGFASRDSLKAEVDAVIAEALKKLDEIAERMDERNSAIGNAITAVRQHDGGQHDPSGAPIAGVRRVKTGYEQALEVDGEIIHQMVPSLAAYKAAASTLEMKGDPQSRYKRRNS